MAAEWVLSEAAVEVVVCILRLTIRCLVVVDSVVEDDEVIQWRRMVRGTILWVRVILGVGREAFLGQVIEGRVVRRTIRLVGLEMVTSCEEVRCDVGCTISGKITKVCSISFGSHY
jgi:hypothetical protein